MSCPTQVTLQTERLLLVPLKDAHLEHAVKLDSDPEVVRFIGNGKPRTRAEVEELHRDRLERANVVPGFGFWAGFVGDEFVGWWILEPPRRADQGPVEDQAELGYRLLRRFWRQGLAKEGSLALLRHGFEDLGLRRVFGETMAVNIASRATMASVGMKFVRNFYMHFDEPIPGSEEGEVEYAISKDEWSANQSS